MPRPIMEAARAAQRLAAARRAIEALAERDPRLRSALHTVLGELGDADHRAAAARRAVRLIAEAADAAEAATTPQRPR
jgi:hypothetical protein